jgi:hypothetical protein
LRWVRLKVLGDNFRRRVFIDSRWQAKLRTYGRFKLFNRYRVERAEYKSLAQTRFISLLSAASLALPSYNQKLSTKPRHRDAVLVSSRLGWLCRSLCYWSEHE